MKYSARMTSVSMIFVSIIVSGCCNLCPPKLVPAPLPPVPKQLMEPPQNQPLLDKILKDGA